MTQLSEGHYFWSQKFRALAGTIPASAFLTFHIWANYTAMQGQAAFERSVLPIALSPLFTAGATLFVYVPLVAHLALVSREAHQGTMTNLRKLALLLPVFSSACFILYCAYAHRIQIAFGSIDAVDVYPRLCAQLSSTTASGIPLPAVLYLAGLAAVCVRMGAGMQEAYAVYRPHEPVSARFVTVASRIVGLVVFGLAANGVLYLATGARLL